VVEGSVTALVKGEPMVAVAFSGGLDSSVVARCAANHTKVIACSAFARGSGDAQRAKKGAEALGVELVTTELTKDVVGSALAGIDLPFQPTLMDRSLWCLYSAVSRGAEQSGARVMFLGQLADELFGGYAKYVQALSAGGEESAGEMMKADLQEYETRGRIRDVGACGRMVEPRLPFAGAEVVELASAIPLGFKIRDGVRKAVLRRAAVLLGVPEEQARAPKKAAQYSSGVQRLVAGSGF
jgi:asparagine synthase (glutamine-hydrolysing)